LQHQLLMAMTENIPAIRISDYTYDLPDEKIALYPLSERDQSRLLVWHNGNISETVFTGIDRILPENALLVFNNTRVIHARLIFHRETGARIEIFCLEPHIPADYQLSFQQTGSVEWKCLVGNAKKWKQGPLMQKIQVEGECVSLSAEMTEKSGNAFIIRFTWDKAVTFAEIIEAAGEIPIPPYLNRPSEESDNERYQTMYARIDGSVAAPTAGLHFTGNVIKKLASKNITTAELTLHVGAGTFQPVKSEQVAEHEMHTETVVITRSFLERLLAHPETVIAVGTTSVRSLESLYWLGANIKRLESGAPLHVSQWEPYRSAHITEHTTQPAESLADNTSAGHPPYLHPVNFSPKEKEPTTPEALQNLLTWLKSRGMDELTFTTSIIIVPGYRFRLIHGMLTNFHQPQSTLLLLISAFLGPRWHEVYEYALRNDFRFLSYGDSNLYLKGS
jgi:S-adenosylmethionine:tRNA ribosyltransferase-isomerase